MGPAMTCKISLRELVLLVDGMKEKTIDAHAASVKYFMLPASTFGAPPAMVIALGRHARHGRPRGVTSLVKSRDIQRHDEPGCRKR